MKYHIISKLKEQTDNSDIDLWLLLDNEHTFKDNYKYDLSEYNTYSFSFNDIEKENKYKLLSRSDDKKYIGNCIYPLLKFYSTHKYEYYMFYEDDLMYTGNIYDLYNRICENKDSDAFFSKHFNNVANDWFWATGKYNVPFVHPSIEQKNQKYSLLCIYILNRRALSVLDKELRTGNWQAHHEFLVPTILYNSKKISINYFSDKINENIVSFTWDHVKKHLIRNKITENSLYHPIKNSMADFLRYEKRKKS